LPARLEGLSASSLPEGKRIARGFQARQLDVPGARPVLRWTAPAPSETPLASRLRIAVALDFRAERQVEAVLAGSGARLGVFDIRYAYALQPFELRLDPAQTSAALAEGVALRAGSGELPLWIFDDAQGEGEKAFFNPHLLLEEDVGGGGQTVFVDEMASLVSLQPFGWLEGCVLDGLQDLARSGRVPQAQTALDAHLAHFLDDNGRLVFEDLRNRPSDDAFPGIESTLPVAVIASQRPGHPVVRLAVDFWEARRRDGGIVCDGGTATAEGAYTVGYPLAVIAARTGREDLARWALRQITTRIELLPKDRDLYLRCPLNGEGRTFRNWARAYAWYMLGLTRTWATLRASSFSALPGMDVLWGEARRITSEALRFRQPDGLWTCFLDRPETGVDTSGSAGIAAAMAIGVRSGLLPEYLMAPARKAEEALAAYLTPDGLLSGVAQHNAGGEALQTGGYRVISQMGMGLLAQLHAAGRNT
jgi:hypothetical protein